jgi:hypothetical protein
MKLKKNHSFGYWDESGSCKNIKYVDTIYDSRDKQHWLIKFRGVAKMAFSTNHFSLPHMIPENWKFDNLFDWIMAYLNNKWIPSKSYFKTIEPHFRDSK